MRASASSPDSDEPLEQRGRGELGVARLLGLLGELADDREDRPLDRPADCAIRRVAGAAQGTPYPVGVNRSLLGERLDRSAQDLGEDHARVAARAHQRRSRQLLRERGTVRCGRSLERLDDGAGGKGEVRARVAVGHGIDVQVVDPVPVRLERRKSRTRKLARPLQLDRLHEVGARHRAS